MFMVHEYCYEGWRENNVRGPVYLSAQKVISVRPLCSTKDGKLVPKGSSIQMQGESEFVHVTEDPQLVCKKIEADERDRLHPSS